MNEQISNKTYKDNISGSKPKVRKQNSQQDVGFDKEAAILRVRGMNRQYSGSPKMSWNLRWEDVEKLGSLKTELDTLENRLGLS